MRDAEKIADEILHKKLAMYETLALYNASMSSLSVPEIVHKTLEFLRDQLDIRHSTVAMLDRRHRTFLVLDILQLEESGFDRGQSIPVQDTVLSEIITERQPRYRPDIASEDTHYPVDGRVLQAGIRSDYLVPLWFEAECLGTLNIASSSMDGISEETRNVITLLTPRLVQALKTAEVFGAFQKVQVSLSDAQSLTHSGTWDWDIVSNDVWWSDEMYRIFGMAPRACEITYERFLETVHPDDRAFVNASVDAALNGSYCLQIDYRICHPDGKIRLIHARGQVETSQGGKPVRMIGVVQDITNRKEMEIALQQSESLLQHAQKMQVVGRLAGGIAHDFNNILTGILGYCEILMGKLRAGDPLVRYGEEIRMAGERGALLANQLLLFSRRKVPDLAVLDIHEVIQGLKGLVYQILGEDIDILLIEGEESGWIRANRSQLEQVIMNLVINAKDAMPQGGSLILQTSTVVLADTKPHTNEGIPGGSYVLLAVKDNGIGIDAVVLPRIFEPFFSTKEVGKGTGLGLFTVYGIVTEMGGHIRVESEPGCGTTFKIYFPCVEGGLPEVAASGVLHRLGCSGSETILVVEDDPGVRALVHESLELQGYRILQAENGEEALQIVRRYADPIHLVISDVVLPKMRGPELVDQLSRLRPDMKVLFVSGYEGGTSIPMKQVEEDAAFLQKPFTLITLAKKVRTVLDS